MKSCLIARLSEAAFWEMDVDEIKRFLEAYNERRKRDVETQAVLVYQLASLIGQAINASFSKAKFPTLQQAFPGLFGGDADEVREQRSINNFIKFATMHNMRRGENNGDS